MAINSNGKHTNLSEMGVNRPPNSPTRKISKMGQAVDFIKNAIFNRNRYKTHSEAVIVSCFFNPQNSPYRLLAFQKWYHSIKHLNHRIIECVIGDAESQLPNSPYITKIHSSSLLWHKESLINKMVAELPPEFKYVFWVDADVLFTNQNWLVEGVEQLKGTAKIIQPFEYCVHLERNQVKPRFNMIDAKAAVNVAHHNERQQKIDPKLRRVWRSFCSNVYNQSRDISAPHADSENYDEHGHVGFAWGARREVLEACPLYDHALVGGADHIIAHAAAGHIPHKCITKSFSDDIDEINEWSKRFRQILLNGTPGELAPEPLISFVSGDLYHLWHGDIASRQYLKRIKEFTLESKNIKNRDKNGLHTVAKGKDKYVRRYFQQREIEEIDYSDFEDFGFDLSEFIEDMGYSLIDIIQNWNNQPIMMDEGEPMDDQPMSMDDQPMDDQPQEEAPEHSMEVQVQDDVQQYNSVQEDIQAVLPDEDEPIDVPVASTEELETAIYHAAQTYDEPEVEPDNQDNSDDGGNFS